MIKVIIPTYPEFKFFENQIKEMYESCQDKICDPNTFEFVRDNTMFFAFVKNKSLIGGIYYFLDSDKLFMNGFAGKKHHLDNLECVKMSLDWFKTDIYAEAKNRASALCLLKCGFKRVEGNLFVFRKIL